MNEARRHRTRNQRKREAQKTACMVFALLLMWLMVFCMFVTTWAEHPAEQPVNGQIYLASIQGGDSYGNLQD